MKLKEVNNSESSVKNIQLWLGGLLIVLLSLIGIFILLGYNQNFFPPMYLFTLLTATGILVIRSKVNSSIIAQLFSGAGFVVIAYGYSLFGDLPGVRITTILIPMFLSLIISKRTSIFWFSFAAIVNIVMSLEGVYHFWGIFMPSEKVLRQAVNFGLPLWSFFLLGSFLFLSNRMNKKHRTKEIALLKATEEKKRMNFFHSFINHELRSPIQAIMTISEMLAMGHISKEETDNYYSLLSQSSSQLGELVNDALDLVKLDEGKMELVKEPFDIVALISELYAFYAEAAISASLQLVLPDDESFPIFSNRKRFKQILTNLITNAIKYSKAETLSISLSKNGATSSITINDNGRGMSAKFVESLFDAWSQENQNSSKIGTGLGTAIIKYLIDALGHTIDVKSVEGQGTSFTIEVGDK